jgi:uncharacterized protein
MRRKLLPALALCAAPLLFQACADNRQNASNAPAAASPAARATPAPAAQRQPVTASAEEVKLPAGGTAEAQVLLDIAEGYHVNANPPSDKFYIGTEVRAEPQEGVTPGKPVYPAAVTRKLSFSDKPLSVYEGRAVIRLPLTADKGAAKGQHTFRARIRVQPCNDEACLPPREIDAAIPLNIN